MRTGTALIAAVMALGVGATVPHAEPITVGKTVTKTRPDGLRRHAAYVELLGKGGMYGVGYDYALYPRLAVGGTASFVAVDGEHTTSVSPYLAFYPLHTRRHRWFVQGGPQIVHLARTSPIPEWPGLTQTGLGGEVSSGYELRSRVLFRVFAMGTVGKGGISPWLGLSLGVTL